MYVVLLIALCLCYYIFTYVVKVKNQRKYAVISMGIVLFLFAALRKYTVGIDTGSYFKEFRDDARMEFAQLFKIRETRDPVFHAFMKILSYFSPDPQIMLVVVSGIVAVGISLIAYYLPGNPLFIFSMFICFRIYSFTFSGLRQAIAMALTWIAFIFLIKEKNFWYLIFTFLATLFHASAICFILGFFIYKIKSNKLFFTIAVLFFGMFFVLGNTLLDKILNLVLPGRFGGYIDRASDASFGFGLNTVCYFLMTAFCLLFYFINKNASNKNKISDTLIRFSFIGTVIFLVGEGFPNLFRISYYFIIYLYPLFAEILNNVFDKKDYTLIQTFLIGLLFIQYIYLGPGAGTNVYTFFWQ